MTKIQIRSLMAVGGVLACGVAVALLRLADFGTDPYTVLMLGLSTLFHSNYHTLFPIVTLLLLGVTFWLDRTLIGFATVVNVFLVSYVCDGTLWLFEVIGWQPDMAGRVLALLGGLAIVCVASSLYMTADLGVSGYDAMSIIASRRGLASFRVCRVATDLICVGAGVLLGASAGVGTVVVALCMGPVVQWFNRAVSEPVIARAR